MSVARSSITSILAAAVVVLCSGIAGAEIVAVTFEGTAIPFTQERSGTSTINRVEGDPFDVSLRIWFDVSMVWTPGSPNTMQATGTVLWCDVFGDTWSESYSASELLSGCTNSLNEVTADMTYTGDPATGIDVTGLLAEARVYGETIDPLVPGATPTGTVVRTDLRVGYAGWGTDVIGAFATFCEGSYTFEYMNVCGPEAGYDFYGLYTSCAVFDAIVPEPASVGLLALGIAAIAGVKGRKRHKA